MERHDLLALARLEPFKSVDILDLDALLRTVPYSARSYGPGEVVALAGSDYDYLLCLVEGSLRAGMEGPDGKTLTVETLEAPTAVASAVLFADEAVLPVTVTTLGDCQLISLSRDAILGLCQKNRAFLVACLAESGNKLQLLAEKMKLLEFRSIRQKMAAWLKPRIGSGTKATLPFSKERLAELFGVTRPSLSRELSAMVKDGIIEVQGRDIIVLDPKALANLL
jgi:CRP/FNR family transcriptional regulator, dissimilatory nitrate respiration regulator